MENRSGPDAPSDDARAVLDKLDAEDRARLLGLWRAARERQHRQMTDAIDGIVQAVPFVLRGAARRILGR